MNPCVCYKDVCMDACVCVSRGVSMDVCVYFGMGVCMVASVCGRAACMDACTCGRGIYTDTCVIGLYAWVHCVLGVAAVHA